GQSGLHRVDNVERRRLPVPGDGNQDTARAVRAHDVVLDLKPVPDLGDVLHVDRRAIDSLDGQIIQLVENQRTAVHPDLIFRAGQLGRPRRQNQILEVQRIRYIDGRKLFRVELLRIQVH